MSWFNGRTNEPEPDPEPGIDSWFYNPDVWRYPDQQQQQQPEPDE